MIIFFKSQSFDYSSLRCIIEFNIFIRLWALVSKINQKRPNYQTFIIKSNNTIRVKKSHYCQRLKKNTIPKNLHNKLESSRNYPHQQQTPPQLNYYSRKTVKLWWEPGQKRKVYQICQLANMVSYYQIHTNWQRHMGSYMYKTSSLIQKPWDIDKRKQRRLQDGRYNTADYQEKCQQLNCFQYYGFERSEEHIE